MNDHMTIFATSLRRMALFYSEHPSPGLIRPVDAIQMALCDVAGAAEYAAQGKQWVKPGVWRKPAKRGKSVENPTRLTNAEAMEMIRHYCPTCGRHVPCRHCEPNASDQ